MTEQLQVGQGSQQKELQEKLWAELHELWSCKEEQRREPRADTGPFVPLRPSAAEFIPSITPFPTGTDGNMPRTGATYWTELEKVTILAVSLRGAALTVLSNLLVDRCSNYRALVTALENRFGTAHQAELHRIKLRNRA